MIADILWYLAYVAIATITYVAYLHFKCMQRINYYQAQGITTLPGYDKFFFGNAGIIKKYKQESDERTGKRPLRVFKNWIMDQVETGEQHSYDASKHPIVIMNFGTNITLYVADPDVLQDLYVTKNSIFDKTGHLAKVW